MEETEIDYIHREYAGIWFASFCRREFRKKNSVETREIDINSVCASLLQDANDDPPQITVKSAGQLTFGLVSVYKKQVDELYEAAYSLLQSQSSYKAICDQMKADESRISQRGKKRKRDDTQNPNENSQIQYDIDFEESFIENLKQEMASFVTTHITTNDQITLKEKMAPNSLQKVSLNDTFTEDFGPLDEESVEQLFGDIDYESFADAGPVRVSTPIGFEHADQSNMEPQQASSLNEISNNDSGQNTTELSEARSRMSAMSHNTSMEPSTSTFNEEKEKEISIESAANATELSEQISDVSHHLSITEPSNSSQVVQELPLTTSPAVHEVTELLEDPSAVASTVSEMPSSSSQPSNKSGGNFEFILPSLTPKQFIAKKNQKSNSRKRKFADENTMLPIVNKLTDNSDILKFYPQNMDIRDAVREDNRIQLKRLKMTPLMEVFSTKNSTGYLSNDQTCRFSVLKPPPPPSMVVQKRKRNNKENDVESQPLKRQKASGIVARPSQVQESLPSPIPIQVPLENFEEPQVPPQLLPQSDIQSLTLSLPIQTLPRRRTRSQTRSPQQTPEKQPVIQAQAPVEHFEEIQMPPPAPRSIPEIQSLNLSFPFITPTLRKATSQVFQSHQTPGNHPVVPIRAVSVGVVNYREYDWIEAKREWNQAELMRKILSPQSLDESLHDAREVPFKFLKDKLPNRKAAAVAFTSVLLLKAKGMVEVTKQKDSLEIESIRTSVAFMGSFVSIEETMLSLSVTDVV